MKQDAASRQCLLCDSEKEREMSVEKVRTYLETLRLDDRIIVLEKSSATVDEAAVAVGCEGKQIAKTLTFLTDNGAIAIVAAGDAKIDNKKYKARFHSKARMIPGDEVESYIGYAPGGVCPFAIVEGVPVYMDVSLQRFAIVYPAAGDDHSAVRLTVDELWQAAKAVDWVDVCKNWE